MAMIPTVDLDAWRDGDPAVVRTLADLELRALGLKR